MVFSATLVAATLAVAAGLVNGASIQSRVDCTAIREGYLSADVGPFNSEFFLTRYHKFTVNAQKQIAYTGDGKNPLHIQFRYCKSLNGGKPFDEEQLQDDTFGQIYDVSSGLCVAITNPNATTGPWFPTLATCGTSASRTFNLRNEVGEYVNSIYWASEVASYRGSYEADDNGKPITHANNQIGIQSYPKPGHAFFLYPLPSDCATIRKGYLAATVNGALKKFTLNAQNQVSYVGDGKNPLAVEFRRCGQLNGDAPTDGSTEALSRGQLYVPSKGLCVTITNRDSTAGPWYTVLGKCSYSYTQQFDLVNKDGIKDRLYWWNINTFVEASYSSDSTGKPVQYANNQIALRYFKSSDHPFHFV